jgi:hypothetical protein
MRIPTARYASDVPDYAARAAPLLAESLAPVAAHIIGFAPYRLNQVIM